MGTTSFSQVRLLNTTLINRRGHYMDLQIGEPKSLFFRWSWKKGENHKIVSQSWFGLKEQYQGYFISNQIPSL